jgi:hypothetical protein
MEGNVVKRVEKQAPFLQTAPPNTWPLREKTPMTEFPDYEPATGRLTLTADELAELGPRLNEFAGVLLGGRMFKNLYSLLDIEGGGRMGTFVFVLRQGDGIAPLVYMYNPSACSFELTPVDSPRQVFIGGMECWAADLLAVLRGEIGVIALLFGRALCWNALPRRLNFDVFSELFRMSHPLRRPAEYLRIYERLLHSCGPVTPSIMHRTA